MPIEEKSEGFGDTVAKFTKATGLDKVAKKVANALGAEDCGCGERQKDWNAMWPYSKKNIQDNDTTNFG